MMSRSDYVMVTPSFAPHVGGVERHVAAVHRSLGEMGLRGRIVVLRDPPPEAASGAEWIGFPYGLSRLRVLARPGSLLRLLLGLQREAGAALHFHDAATLHPFLPYLRGLGLLDRTYVTFHGWEGVYPPEAVVRRQRAACAAAAAGTMIVGDFITKWYGTAGNCVTYGGADVARFASGFPPAAELPLRAAYVGRLEPDTGLPVILDAVRALRNEAGVAVPLTVFGTGSLEQEVRRELGAAAVERAPADILDVYRSHPIIFASGYLTILEALCAGRIVFACYDNPLRHDYLAMHPAADALTVCGGTPSVLEGLRACRDNMPAVLERSRPGWAWAREHSWARLAGQYRELWSGAERGLSLHG